MPTKILTLWAEAQRVLSVRSSSRSQQKNSYVGRLRKNRNKRSGTSALDFDSLFVPEENLLGEEGHGFNVAMATLDGGRIGIAAQALGIAQRAFDLAVDFPNKEAFGKPIARRGHSVDDRRYGNTG